MSGKHKPITNPARVRGKWALGRCLDAYLCRDCGTEIPRLTWAWRSIGVNSSKAARRICLACGDKLWPGSSAGVGAPASIEALEVKS